jgi:hypothetical protein
MSQSSALPKHSHLDEGKDKIATPPSNYSKLIDLLSMSGKYKSNIQLEALSLWHFLGKQKTFLDLRDVLISAIKYNFWLNI